MNSMQVVELSKNLKELSLYTKNLITYKSKESKEDYVHIRSFQRILENRIEQELYVGRFFNGQESVVVQLLNYLINTGELHSKGNGYYTVLPARKVQLPYSKIVFEIGKMTTLPLQELSLGSAAVIGKSNEVAISLQDYRYDFSLREWLSVFQQSTKTITFFDEEYYKPTKYGYQKMSLEKNLVDGNLYYVISYPFSQKKEHYIAKKVQGTWKGEKVNNNFWKSKLALL